MRRVQRSCAGSGCGFVRLTGQAESEQTIVAPSSACVRAASGNALSKQICIPIRPTGVSNAANRSPAAYEASSRRGWCTLRCRPSTPSPVTQTAVL